MHRLDSAHWHLLAELLRLGTMTAAAEAVMITQSAASQRLREAERRLGIALVERRGRSIGLTRSGRRIAETGAYLERHLSVAEADAIWLGRNEGDRLRVLHQCHDSPEWLVAFYELAADTLDIKIELVRCNADNASPVLARGDADVSLMPLEANYPGVSSVHLFNDRLVGIVGADDPLAEHKSLLAEDFTERHYFTYETMPQAGFELERFFRPAERYPAHIIRIESTATILSLVARSLGVSILTQFSLSGHDVPHRIHQKPLAGDPLEVSWYLHVSDANKSTAIHSAIDHLVTFLADAPARMPKRANCLLSG